MVSGLVTEQVMNMHITGILLSRRPFLKELKMILVTIQILKLGKFNIFGQASKTYFNEKLSLSLGVRTDINTFSAVNVKSSGPDFTKIFSVLSSYRQNESELQHRPVFSASSIYCHGILKSRRRFN